VFCQCHYRVACIVARFMSRGKTVSFHSESHDGLNRTDLCRILAILIVMHEDGKRNLYEIALCHVRLHYHPINMTLMRFEGRAKDVSTCA